MVACSLVLYRVMIVSVLVLHPIHSLVGHIRPVFSRSRIFVSLLHTAETHRHHNLLLTEAF